MSSAKWETPKPGEMGRETVLDKKAWHQVFDEAVAEAQRQNTALSVIFIDVNHFKDVNDSLGHAYGDQLINDIKNLLSENVRLNRNRPGKNTDIIFAGGTGLDSLEQHNEDFDFLPGHLGGDEFGIMCKTDDFGARIIADRLRESFDNYTRSQPDEFQDLGISVSMGVGVLQEGMTAGDLLHYADREMYEDKLRQLPPLSAKQSDFLMKFHEDMEAHAIRLRDVGKYLLMLSRSSED